MFHLDPTFLNRVFISAEIIPFPSSPLSAASLGDSWREPRPGEQRVSRGVSTLAGVWEQSRDQPGSPTPVGRRVLRLEDASASKLGGFEMASFLVFAAFNEMSF